MDNPLWVLTYVDEVQVMEMFPEKSPFPQAGIAKQVGSQPAAHSSLRKILASEPHQHSHQHTNPTPITSQVHLASWDSMGEGTSGLAACLWRPRTSMGLKAQQP